MNSSNLYIECTPSDPHTASNIVINTYISKTNRTLLQTRICWSRYKFLTESQHSFENLTYVTGNVYRCEPSDLGSYIQAKITVNFTLFSRALMLVVQGRLKSPLAPFELIKLLKM